MIHLNKIIKYGTYLLIFILPLQTRFFIYKNQIEGTYFEYGTISLYLSDVLLILILVLLLIEKIKSKSFDFSGSNKKFFANEKFWLLLGLLELAIFISCFIAVDKIVAFYFYLRFLAGVGLLYLIINTNSGKPDKEMPTSKNGSSVLVYIFLASAFVQSLLAVFQVASQKILESKWLGMASHFPETLGASVVELENGVRWLRAYGSLDHPNLLGGLMLFAFLLAAAEAMKVRKNNSKLFFLFVSITFFTIALFLSFSRGAWLALICGIAVLLFINVIKRKLFEQKRILEIILISSSVFFILFSTFNDLVMTRMTNTARLEQKSSTERISGLRQALLVIEDNRFFGVGAGNYTQELQNRIKDKEVYFYQPVHNIFLLVAAEIGIFGLSAFVITIYYLFIIAPALVVPLIVLFLFDHWLWSLHFGLFLLFFLTGIILLKKEEHK